MTFHRSSLWILYTLTVVTVVYLAGVGGGYYSLPQIDRPYHPLHSAWKPSGVIGHGVGILGSFLMLVLLLYSVRKRVRFMQSWGNIRLWLNYHIWMGVTGPLLVIFHSTFKLGGIVAVSFWSMVGVALSGIIGRYIYLQIPRSLSGQELSARELNELDRILWEQLRENFHVDADTLELIQQASTAGGKPLRRGWIGLWDWLREDFSMPTKLKQIRKRLRESRGFNTAQIREVMEITRRKIRLRRRMAFLATAQSLLHHWHVIHRPFAFVMLAIMVVHVVITILFGYRWVFGTAGNGV